MKWKADIEKNLERRKIDHLYRILPSSDDQRVDFWSNDYLGLARNEDLKEKIVKCLAQNIGQNLFGSTGSRLVSGNYSFYNEIEQKFADFYQSESAIYFKSGFEANISLISLIGTRDAVLFYDEHIHASFRFGMQRCAAKHFSFKHNDIEDLRSKRSLGGEKVFVITESVFSIIGDSAPLKDLVDLCEQNGWVLIVDEAHTNGIFGTEGEGLVSEKKLANKILLRVMPFGKAFGAGGAVLLCPKWFRDYIINAAMPFIYSTGASLSGLIALQHHFEFIKSASIERNKLFQLIETFQNFNPSLRKTNHPIQSIEMENAEKAVYIAKRLCNNGFSVKAMVPPTSPEKRSYLRITLHSFNNSHEIEIFFENMRKLL